MLRTKSIVLARIVVAVLATTSFQVIPMSFAATTYTEYSGTLGAAGYTIRIPSPIGSWNRDLIIGCRGYMHDLIADPMMSSNSFYSLEGWSSAAIARGAAFAISNYGVGGYCVQEGIDATYQLTQYVKSTYNVTGRIYIEGASMGGNIALILGYKYPNVYSGVLDICGAKNLTVRYNHYASISAASDSELSAILQSVNAPEPPYPFSLYGTFWRTYFRSWASQAVADMAAEFGGTPSAVPQAYQNVDPMFHANISIPVITVCGTSDALVPYKAGQEYQAAVTAAGKSSLYRFYPVDGGEHVDDRVVAEGANRLNELISWSVTIPEFSGPMFFVAFASLLTITVALLLRKPMRTKKFY